MEVFWWVEVVSALVFPACKAIYLGGLPQRGSEGTGTGVVPKGC